MKHRLRLLTVVLAELAIIAGCLAWYFSPWAAGRVQPITVTHGPHVALGAPEGVTEFYSLDELRRDKARDVQLSRPVDFTREKLVRVDWSDTGPLNARIVVRPRWGARHYDFCIEKPPANYATFIRMVYQHWYTVPYAASVRFAGRETLSTAGFNLLALTSATLLCSAVAIRRRWR